MKKEYDDKNVSAKNFAATKMNSDKATHNAQASDAMSTRSASVTRAGRASEDDAPEPRVSDEALAEEAKRGDKAALETIARRYEGLVRRAAGATCLRTVRDDALGAAWEELIKAALTYDARTHVPFAGYAKARVTYGLYTFFKRERRKWQRECLIGSPTDEMREDAATGDTTVAAAKVRALADPKDAYAGVEARDELERLAASLTERHRALLDMLYREGLTQREAARRLGVTQQAAAAMKKRAVEEMRKRMKE